MNSLILTAKDGKEIREQPCERFDCDVADTKDFELEIRIADYDDKFVDGAMIFVPGTEYGGIIKCKKVDTRQDNIVFSGYNWRGVLYNKIISPPAGQGHKIVNGELNFILRGLIQDANLGDFFYVPEIDSGITLTNYQFDRYISLYNGIEKMLNQVQNIGQNPAYRMDIQYIQGEYGRSGYLQLQALPCEDYSEEIELSQDSELNFVIEQVRNGVNHLICLGSGELAQRVVRHLYADINGNISTTQTLFGVDEVVAVYDYSSVEDEASLISEGVKHLQDSTNYDSFAMDAATLDIDVAIGDKIGGRDYVTGMVCVDYITNKIYRVEGNKVSIEYKIGGEQKDEPEEIA